MPFAYGYGQQLWNQGENMEDPKVQKRVACKNIKNKLCARMSPLSIIPSFATAQAMNTWVIVDEVQVPAEKGDYVLRWRWDTEQNPQVCA